jgi:ATP-dependent Lon protease
VTWPVDREGNRLYPVLPLRDTSLFPKASLAVIVVRPPVLHTIEVATRTGNILLALSQHDPDMALPAGSHDFNGVGTLAHIAGVETRSSGEHQVDLDGLTRARVVDILGVDTFVAETQMLEEGDAGDEWGAAVEALARYLHSHSQLRTFLESQRRSSDPMSWVNLACQHLPITSSARQRLLEADALERCLKISRGLDALLRKEQSL